MVVVQQSAGVVPAVVANYQPDAGHAALMLAMVVTIMSLVCGCWWSIICSIPGIIFANAVSFNSKLAFRLYSGISEQRTLCDHAIIH